MSKIGALYACIKNLEEEDGFEEFDEFYDKVMSKEIIFNLEDIKKICLIFNDDNNIMEPHNFMALRRMTFITIDNYGIEKGFDELIKGLIEIVDNNHVESKCYINMLMNSYDESNISIFAELLNNYKKEDKKKIGNLVKELIVISPDEYKERGNIILSVLSNK